MSSTALCRAVQSVYCGKMIGWMQTLFYLGQEASADLGYVSNATTSRCFAVTINQNRTGKIKTEQAKTKQTNKQPMGHQDSTREFGNDAARRNPIWGNLQTLALPRGVQCVSKRRQIWCQLTISLENDKLSEQFWSPAEWRLVNSNARYIQLAKDIPTYGKGDYQRQDGPWHWVNSVRNFYQFYQLFPPLTIFECRAELTFFGEFDAIFSSCVS